MKTRPQNTPLPKATAELERRVEALTLELRQENAGRRKAETALGELQALYHSLVDQMPAGIFRKNPEGRFIFVNAFFCRLKRLTAAELLHKTARDHALALDGRREIDPALIQQSHAGVDHHRLIMQTGRQIEVEECYRDVDGTTKYLQALKSAIKDADGRIIGSQGILFDITERKEAEIKLAETGALLNAMLENTPDLIYFKDRESRFVRFSRAFATRFNLADAEFLRGKTDFDLFTPEHAQAAYDDEQKILGTGVAIIGKLEKETYVDGGVMWALTTKMPWRDPHGQVVGSFGISTDVTAWKEAEAKLADTHQRLLETSRLAGMTEVATGVLHNVGNVLNSVNVSATLVADRIRHTKAANVAKVAALLAQHQADLAAFLTTDPRGSLLPGYLGTLAESLAEEQATLIAELDHLRKNIDHIKDIVAIQQAHAKTSGAIETISLPDLIEDALRINVGSLARHDVDVARDYQARPVITTDRHKVMQILINLIRNAKQACDESGRSDKTITVRTTSEPAVVKIAISDNGVGIPAENLARIFSHGFTTKKSGHGFGLHSAALAAKELGGALSAHSDGPGRGAVFTLDLPDTPQAVAC